MTRIDRLVLLRMSGSFFVSLVVLAGLVILAELLSPARYLALMTLGGPGLALAGLLARAGRWAIETLPLTILIGAVAGLLRLETTREMTIIKASGRSVWQVMRAPLAASLLVGLVVTAGIQPAVIALDRALTTGQGGGNAKALWFEERSDRTTYVLEADNVVPGGLAFTGITVFGSDDGSRIVADGARLEPGSWLLTGVTRYLPGNPGTHLDTLRLPARTTPGDLALRLGVFDDLTIYELGSAVLGTVSDPAQQTKSLTRLIRLVALPLSLAGSVMIAFAFTAGYRRVNRYGSEMLYGILAGFVIYVAGELAGRAGYAGVLPPVVAVLVPAAVTLMAGVTVLLFREDGLR